MKRQTYDLRSQQTIVEDLSPSEEAARLAEISSANAAFVAASDARQARRSEIASLRENMRTGTATQADVRRLLFLVSDSDPAVSGGLAARLNER